MRKFYTNSLIRSTAPVRQIARKHQATRATGNQPLLSIVLNIAEGSAKLSDPDFARFMETSSGSINEVLAGFEVALDDGYISAEQLKIIEHDAEHIAKQLGGFIRSLRKPSNGNRKSSVVSR